MERVERYVEAEDLVEAKRQEDSGLSFVLEDTRRVHSVEEETGEDFTDE